MTSIVVDAAHESHLVAAIYVGAILAPVKDQPNNLSIVSWHTLCVGFTTPEQQALQEIARLEWPAVPAPFESYLRPREPMTASAASATLLGSSPGSAPSSDPSFAPSSDDEGSEDSDGTPEAPSSDAFMQDGAYSARIVEHVANRLSAQRACQCGASRTFEVTCGNAQQAEHLRQALRSPELASRVDSKALLPGDLHSLSVEQFMASKHVNNPRTGDPPRGAFLKLARYPFEVLPDGAAGAEDLPLDPKFFGTWLGDGTNAAPQITSTDLDETREYLSNLVGRLNASRPHGAAPLHLHVASMLVSPGRIGPPGNLTCFSLSITSTRQDGVQWNPILNGLRVLDIFDNHKRNGTPEQYLTASTEVRAALLPGFIETDGSIRGATGYTFTQCVDHRRLFEDTRRLAEGLGIKIGRVQHSMAPSPRDPTELNPALTFTMSGPELDLLQPYITLPRKKLHSDFIDARL